jgi:peroxiredoxin
MTRRLEVLANAAFLIVCVMVTAVLGRQLVWPTAPAVVAGAPSRPAPAPRPVYQPGERIELAGVDFTKSDKTLLLVIRSTCKYCTESMPFYKGLAGNRVLKSNVRIVGVSPDEIPVSEAYLGQYQLKLSGVVKIPLGALKVRGTPTAILVDRNAVIKQVWPGLLDEVRQQEVIRAISGRP